MLLSLRVLGHTRSAAADNSLQLIVLLAAPSTGLLARINAGGVSARLSTGLAWYNSSTDAEQPSGAYIFRWVCGCSCCACTAQALPLGNLWAKPAGCETSLLRLLLP